MSRACSWYARGMHAPLAGLVLALFLLPAPAHAQGRRGRGPVIQLEDVTIGGAMYGPVPFADVVVVPDDPCPGATWLAACGGPPPASGECPTLTDAAQALGEARIASCAPTPALVPVAEALVFDPAPQPEGQPSSLERAQRIYGSLASLDALRGLALHRAAMLAYQRARYAEALSLVYEILAAPRSEPLRLAALELGASIVAHEDHDEDTEYDDGFPESRLTTSALPEAPFARELAVRALAGTGIGRLHDTTLEMIAAILVRWPDTPTEALDREAARALREAAGRTAALVDHLVAAATRCRATHTACDAEHLDELTAIAVEGMRACGTGGAALDPARIDSCQLGAARARRVLALRASADLESDATLAEAWVAAADARRRAERARPRRRADREARAAVLAAPLPPDVTPRTAVAARPPRTATAQFRWLRSRIRRQLQLARCASAAGMAEAMVRARWTSSDQPVALEPLSAISSCARRALDAALRDTHEDDTVGTILLFFPPPP